MGPRERFHVASIALAVLAAAPRTVLAQAGVGLDAEFRDEYDAYDADAKPAAAAPAPAPVSALTPAPASARTAPAAASVFDQDPTESITALRARAQNTWHGATGGLHLLDAATGLPGSVRLQLGFEYFYDRNYLYPDDENQTVGGTLSLSVTPADQLELFASLANLASSNNYGDPILLQAVGDALLGIKAFGQATPWLSFGADFRVVLLNTVGDLGVVLGATSFGFGLQGTADLRRLRDPAPLLFRANTGYFFDNSSVLIEPAEEAAYQALPPATRRSRPNEVQHLVTRSERLGLGVNRVDQIQLAAGVEAPLQVARDFHVQPLLEWRLGVPVNRQGYNCLAVVTNAGTSGEDGCLALAGLSAAPQTLSLGARVLPPVRGFGVLVAADIGLSGTSTFVRELAPTRPWVLLLTLSYGVDARPSPVRTLLVKAPAAAAPPPVPARGQVAGRIVAQGSAIPIAGAAVRYPEAAMTAQLTGDDGRFTSYELRPGAIVFEVSHPDYEPRMCRAAIAEPPADTPVALTCELTARPRGGQLRVTVTSDQGEPVAAAQVELSGPVARALTTDATGGLVADALPAGAYAVRVDATGYLLKLAQVKVEGDASLQITLAKKPETALVVMTKSEVKIRRQIQFKVNAAEIDERSHALLSEIADVLSRNPQVRSVQVQGHTDNRGDAGHNAELSQRRAEAVVQWLVGAGIDAARLEAKGYGDSRPLVPNLTAGNRARNRRVQLIIRSQ